MKNQNLFKHLKLIIVALCISSGMYNLSAQTTLQELIDKTADGGTVILPAGKYVIDSPLKLEGRKNLSLQGNGKCRILLTNLWVYVMEINNCNTIKLEGIYLSHLNPMKEYECNGGVINVTNSKHITVDNCEMEGSGTIGIAAQNVIGLTVSHCYIHDNTFNAFYFSDVGGIHINSCLIEKNANLLQSSNVRGIGMSDNIIKNNGGYWSDKDKNPGLRK